MKYMKDEQKTEQQQIDNPLHDLIEIIQFAENVTAKIHGLRDEAEIFRVVIDEFSSSDHFVSTILLLSDDGLSIKLSDTSLSLNNLKAMEKAAGVFREHYKIDLNKSSIFSRVVRDGETIMATGTDIIGELFPRPLVIVLVKLLGLGNQPSILTPLYKHERIIGILSLSAPELGDFFITSVKNLAHHITIALELADEHNERKQAEEALKKSEAKYRNLLSTTGIPITYFDLNGYVLLVNEASAQNFHTTPDRLIGKSLYELLPGVADEIVAQIRNIADTGEEFEYEDWRELPSGTFCFSTYIQPMKEADGSIQGVQVISHDITERKRAEDALRDSEEKYRSLVEQSLQGHLIFQDDHIAFTNQAFAKITGHSIRELMDFNPQKLRELVHHDDRDWVFERLNDRMTGKTVPLRYEYRLIRKDSSVCWVETYTDRVNYLGNLAMQATFLDITERKQAEEETKRLNNELMEANAVLEEEITDRKQAEEALKNSEMRFRALFENASDGIAVIDTDGTVSYTAPSNDRMLGFEPGESGSVTLLDQIDQADKERLAQDFANLVQNPSNTLTSVYHALHKNGELRTIEASGRNLLHDPNIQGIVVNFKDVTERELSEVALRESEEKFRNIFEHANDEIIYMDAVGTILDVNNRVFDIFGYHREDLIGKNFAEFDFINEEGMNFLMERFANAIDGDSIPLTEVDIERKDGRKVTVELSVRVIRANGETRSLLAIVRDITERKLAEEETKRLNTQLMEANVVLEEEISDRKRAEEALRYSEERFRSIIENADDAITLIDSEGIISYASPSLERIAGYDPNSLVGTLFRDYMHEDDFSAMESNFAKIVSSPGHAESIAMRLKRMDGSWCWVEGVGKNFLNDPQVQAIVCNYRDITERKQAEEALCNSEAHWRSLVENAPNIIMSVDSDGTIWSINRIVPGLTSEQVIGSKIYDFIDPEFHNAVRQTTKRVLQTGNPGTYEVQGTGPDGSASWYETQIGPVTQDYDVVALTLITTDITDRKNSEEEIMQRNRELAALNEIAQEISQTLDLDEILNNALDKTLDILNTKYGAIAFTDDEAESLTIRTARGTSDDVVNAVSPIKLGEVAKSIWDQLREPLFIESLSNWIEVISSESLKTALEQPIESAMFVPLRSKGELLGVICAFTESGRVFTPEERGLLITIGHQISTAIENAQLLEEVSRAEALEELDKLRTALLASVSHELRTPLTSIKGLASTLTQPDVEWDAETQQDFLEIIDRESDILTHIVEDLMQMSQMEAGIMTMEKTRSNIASTVNQLGAKLSDLTVAHEFEIDIPAEMAPIHADEIRIGEVITNLVANAASYSEQGTLITLVANEKDGQIIVSVTDSGIGIPPEHMDKVFDRFYRLESGVARRRGGTGLGLSICKGIIEGHDGKIWVTSTPDKGSTFSFSLPIADNSEIVYTEQMKQ